MTALTADRNIWRRDGVIVSVPVKANQRIFKGALVSTVNGLAVPASDTSGHRFKGIAVESADNIGGADHAKTVCVWQSGIFPVKKPSAVLSDVGQEIACVDDCTVNLLSVTTNDIKCGRIVRVLDTGEVEIKIDGYAY